MKMLGRLVGGVGFAAWGFAVMSSMAACGTTSASLCDRVCECMGCSESERTSCVDDLDDAAKAAGDQGCEDTYDEYLGCIDDQLTCVGDRVEADGCDAEAQAFAECTNGAFPGFGDPCSVLSDRFAACDGGSTGQVGEAQCTQAQQVCAACFLSSGKDLCTELLDIANDCVDACS